MNLWIAIMNDNSSEFQIPMVYTASRWKGKRLSILILYHATLVNSLSSFQEPVVLGGGFFAL